jgi:hypothetical protein
LAIFVGGTIREAGLSAPTTGLPAARRSSIARFGAHRRQNPSSFRSSSCSPQDGVPHTRSDFRSFAHRQHLPEWFLELSRAEQTRQIAAAALTPPVP